MKISEKIHDLRKNQENYPNKSANWLLDKLRNPDKKFQKITPQLLEKGKFYLIKHDMREINKTTKMEQIIPCMMVEYKPKIDKRVVWILNMNFITRPTKEAFFSSYMDKYENLIEENNKKNTWREEGGIPGVNYQNTYQTLLKYGYEYAIREIRLDLIEEIYGVSTDYIHKLITANTQKLTGVDEEKINDIWRTKMKNEGMKGKVQELYEIKNNYQAIINELRDKFKNIERRMKDL